MKDDYTDAEKRAYATGRADSVRNFQTSLEAALTEAKKSAWAAGYTSGHSNAMRRMSDEPNAPTTPNPYGISPEPTTGDDS